MNGAVQRHPEQARSGWHNIHFSPDLLKRLRLQAALLMNHERNVQHVGVLILMPVDFFHQLLIVMIQGINRQTHVVAVHHNQAVIPYAAGLQLFNKLPERVVSIIL
ncbi:hypothetical protein D3C81_1794770 [compost metagenome]